MIDNFTSVKYFDVNFDEIDVFSNDTSVSVKGDVVMVKSDVKSLITSIFSQLQMNHSNFTLDDVIN